MPEEAKDKQEQKKDEKDDYKVVLKVDMHCEACKAKVRRSLRDFPGLENIDINMEEQKVTVKGKVDAKKVLDRVKKKCCKRTELLFPKLNNDLEKKKEEKKEEKEEKKEPPEVIVELKVKMHCGGCATEVKKALEKMDGVCGVKVDMEAEKVIVNGRNIDPKKICDRMVKKTGKHAEIVPPPVKNVQKDDKEEGKKDGNKDEKKDDKQDEKKDEKKQKDEKPEEKKDEKQEEKMDDDKNKQKDETPEVGKKEEKQDDKKEESKEENKGLADTNVKKEEANDVKMDQKRSENTPMKSVPEYVYAPQLFSDENPNACSIM